MSIASFSNIRKIDNKAVLGLSGTPNSAAYKIHEIEKHFHNYERWYGKSADQSGDDWNSHVGAPGMPVPFTVISGNDDYGADANDEAKVWGLDDTNRSEAQLDSHELLVTASSVTSIWYLRIIHGSGTMAAAIAADKFSDFPIVVDPAVQGSADQVLHVTMPRIMIGVEKIWVQGKNTTDNATLQFIIGVHSYVG